MKRVDSNEFVARPGAQGMSQAAFRGVTQLIRLPVAASAEFEGLLVLLVTDLQRFTAMVERLGDLSARATMREHNQLLRDCIRRNRGREVAHTGDGFLAAFRSVAAALNCARSIQQGLRRLSDRSCGRALRARVGLHAGEPLPEDHRLFGTCVNTAVRVCAAADPGRVLVTDVVRQLAQGRFRFESGRLHKLKGISTRQRLYEFR